MNFNATDALMGLTGGLLIGLASAIFLLGNGRIAGISGVLGALLRAGPDWRENFVFIAGLVAAPVIYGAVGTAPAIGITSEPALLVIGGLMVGAGTRIGNGCTSGHGVCGLSRFSKRSMVAVVGFMGVAVLVASVIAPMMGLK